MTNRNRTREHHCPGEFCQVPTIQAHEMDYNEDDEFVYGWRCHNCGRWEAKRVVSLSNDPDRKPTPGQQAAIDRIKRHITDDLDQCEHREDQITKFELKSAGFGGSWWLTVETEMLGLSKNSVLRALDQTWWHFEIGARGAVTAHSYPKSYEQFKGRRVFGFINVK